MWPSYGALLVDFDKGAQPLKGRKYPYHEAWQHMIMTWKNKAPFMLVSMTHYFYLFMNFDNSYVLGD